ncbi:MAG: RelA/SpoT family protein [Deltaproteobacteria bacterium]
MEEQLYQKLIARIKEYYPQCDFAELEKAYNFAKNKHEGQTRISGEPYIVHPLEVANLLANIELDSTSIVAGLLHDIIEDTECTFEQIQSEFGSEVALIVDGVTKLEKIPYTTKEEQQVENLRKMFLSMAKDIRVILIKLVDRIHNMRTLKYKTPEKQLEKARETLEIYAPLAHRLGMYKIKWELEDLSLRYIDPKGYYELVDKISKKRREREAFIEDIVKTLNEKLLELNVEATIEGRPKHFYSIYRKMKEQNKTLEQIYDLFAVRIIVNSIQDCYSALGLVHELYKPMPGRFKDYIGIPKPNMYQSLHTTLLGLEGVPFEVQIRTWEMHRIAEYGIAAHWKYKEGQGQQKDDMDSKLVWLRQLLEWQKEMRDAKEFMETLKVDLFTDEVFVFTPKGDVINLPVKSTPIDFAYNIHSAVGNKMLGAKVNGRMVSLDYTLNNGDIVEILTSSNVHGPSLDWLKIVKSTQAKNKILQWFKKERREENIIKGKDSIEKELKKHGLVLSQLPKGEWLETVFRRYGYNSVEDCLASVGYGGITALKIATKIVEEFKKQDKSAPAEPVIVEPENKPSRRKEKGPESGIVVKGIENCLVRLSKCCNPLPGDDIMGYITRGRGVSVHRADCTNVKEFESEQDRIVEVHWYVVPNLSYNANLQIQAFDRNGLFVEISNTVTEAKAVMRAINARTVKNKTAVMNLTIEIHDTEQLEKIIKKIKRVEGVYEVTRY